MTPEIGLHAEVDLVVGEQDTASAMGSGDMPVLATPRLLAVAEEATVAAVADALEDERTTVGTCVSLRHLAASPIGSRVSVRAELREAEQRRLVFDIRAHDGEQLAAEGTVERAVVQRSRFLDRLDRSAGPA